MASTHLSIRIDKSTLERLDAEIERIGKTRSEVAKTLIEEGLRMQDHPGIMFRSGPAGRRAGLIGGPDIWEIATAVIGLKRDGCFSPERVAELASLSQERVSVALRYYAEYQAEIDESIRRRDESSERRRAAWLREQALIKS